jgi:hypothetical protein
VYGRLITSKKEGYTGNSVFLPAAGSRRNSSLSGAGSSGGYWSRTLIESYPYYAWYLYLFLSNVVDTQGDHRCLGYSVRPVRVSDTVVQLVTSITLSQTTLTLEPDGYKMLMATVLPSNASNKNVTWSSSNESVAEVASNGGVTAIGGGQCTITCTAKDGSGISASCTVTVVNDHSGTIDGRDYVDLGLPSGTLWATCNVGADSPEGYGDCFAWGETVPYGQEDTSNATNYAYAGNYTKTYYNWSTYKWCNGSNNTMTKYCTSSSYGFNGFTDDKTELDPEDDAAYVNWGPAWRMPSLEQMNELRTNCTWTWTTKGTVNGYEVTGSNGNSIFLPAAGYGHDSSLGSAGSCGVYWSRTLFESNPGIAWYLYFDSSFVTTDEEGGRYFGLSVRPVRVSE